KSLGWEWVEEEVLPIIKEFELPLADLLHTCCVHIAEQIAISAKQVGAQGEKMLITGGGKHNTFLLEQIEGKLSKVGIAIDQSISDDIIDYKEAIVFAFLGLRTLLGKPTTLASVTGAEYDVITGSVHLPGRGGYSFF
ncbi:MAG: anhydro-N-acetylmuramic acid kinase, partial [Bacteroidetes bacterium]|nr:anhydro-N-acetylmuramic acid kinase [Bacteroidota bacterium]